MGGVLSLAGAVALPLGSGFAMGLFTRDDVKGWYSTLKKPSWNPPNALFAPVWSVLYASMGVTSWLVARSKGGGKGLPLALYGAQLALNLLWTPLFFKSHKLDVALADSVALLGIATAATVKMADKAPAAAVWPLMAPYLAWVTFATGLNFELLRLNPDAAAVDWRKVGRDAGARAKEDTAKVVQAAEKAGEQAAKRAREAADIAAAEAKKVADKASAAAAEVAKKAQHDAAELAATVQDGIKGSGAGASSGGGAAAAAPATS